MNKAFYLIDHRLIGLAMLVVLVLASEVGYRRGAKKVDSPESQRTLMSGVGAAILGLLGLMLGFTLSMAIARWDERRDVLVNESNAIGTLWLRAGLLDEPLRRELRGELRKYVDARIALAGSRADIESLQTSRKKSEALHSTLWAAIENSNQPDTSNAVMSSLIASANEVIDLHELRLASIENYLPAPIFLLLLAIAALSIGFLGWSFGAASQRNRAAILLLALLIATVLLLIMDLNRPQRGRLEVGTGTLERAKESMAVVQP